MGTISISTNLHRPEWSAEEDAQLFRLIKKHGVGRWAAISRDLKTRNKRSPKAIRNRWVYHLDPNLIYGSFTAEEDNILIQQYYKLGPRWTEISKSMPGRTDKAIKTRWFTLRSRRCVDLQKAAKKLRCDSGHEEQNKTVSDQIPGFDAYLPVSNQSGQSEAETIPVAEYERCSPHHKECHGSGSQSHENLFYTSVIEVLLQNNQDVELKEIVTEITTLFETKDDKKNHLYDNLGLLLLMRNKLDLAVECFIAAERQVEALKTVNKIIASKIRDLPCEDLSKDGQQYQEDINCLHGSLSKFQTVYLKLSDSEISSLEARQAVQEFFEMQQISNMLNDMWTGCYQKAMDRFQSLSFIPKKQDEIQGHLKQLQESFPLVSSVLHKVFGVFCGYCSYLQRIDTQWRPKVEAPITIFQSFIQGTAQNSAVATNQIGEDLSKALIENPLP